MHIRFTPILLLILLLSNSLNSATAVELTQVVSRENPLFVGTGKTMTVGRDGRVYLVGGTNNKGFVLRVSRDATERFGGQTVYAITGVAANADGVFATSNAHFAKAINVYGPDWDLRGKAGGFTGNDNAGWNAPGGVEVGASGDFYGLDQHENAIVRVSPDAKIVQKYPIDADAGPGRSPLRSFRFRVCEATDSFFFDTDNGVRCADFTGRTRWVAPVKMGGNPYNGYAGAFDVDDEGRLWAIDGTTPVIRQFDTKGNESGQVELQLREETPYRSRPVQELRIWKDEIVLRRRSETSLFDVFDRKTGTLIRSVPIAHERLSVRFDEAVWEAGHRIGFAIAFESNRIPQPADPAALRPDLRVWIRPLNTVRFTEVTLREDHLTVPADFSGLYQVRVTAGLSGAESEYLVQTVVEIRPPGAVGAISLYSPMNRSDYGRGETIPVTVRLRTREETPVPDSLGVQLVDHSRQHRVWRTRVKVDDSQLTLSVPPSTTQQIQPGEYLLTIPAASVPKWTIAPQYLTIGEGFSDRPKFSIVQHGDYYAGYPEGDFWNTPERVEQHLEQARRLRMNLFVDRLGHGGSGKLHMLGRPLVERELISRLENDPIAVAPEKARLENPVHRSIAAYGAHGIEQQGILLYMDAGLPIGTGYDKREPQKMIEDLKTATEALTDYPAMRGWSWAANWWFGRRDARLKKSDLSEERQAAYLDALKQAEQTGQWSRILEEVSDIWLNWPVEAERRLDAALQDVAPGKKSVMTAPYRQPLMIPPVVFRNADEVDLHFQAEQIQWPQTSPFNVDFYKRPGKRAWGHPELKNDDGTGDMIVPTLFEMVMRGADGIGQSGHTKGWVSPQTEPRAIGQGTTSIHRVVNQFLHDHGEFFASMETVNPIAIPVSTRMMRIEEWGGIGGWYFTRIFEAYQACLYAHRPAQIVFVEDMERPDESLVGFDAVLVVSQTVELDPRLATALQRCKEADVPIFYDETCRSSLLEPFAASSLGIAFDRVEDDPHPWQDDTAYLRCQRYFLDHAARLREVLGETVAPIADCKNPEVLLSESVRGDARVLWAINNTMTNLEPAHMWRVGLTITNRLPVVEEIQWHVDEEYEIFDLVTGRKLDATKPLVADMRTFPASVFVAVKDGLPPALARRASEGDSPQPVPSLARRASEDGVKRVLRKIGSHLRDLAISPDGRTAMVSAANWDENVFVVNLDDGNVRWQTKAGHHYAYDPQATSHGFTVQGFDLNSAEGYHLYLVGDDGRFERRFALYGLPKKATGWANAKQHTDPINNFAVSPDGTWVASAGDLGLAVWSRVGDLLWSDDWWHEERKRVFLLAANPKTLVTMAGSVARGHDPHNGKILWQHQLGETGTFDGAVASRDGKTIVLRSSAEGGRLFVLRDGRHINTLPTTFNEAALSPDGRWVAVTETDVLKLFRSEGGLKWSMTADDLLRYPRFSPDGQRIVVGSEIGALYVLGVEGREFHRQDLGALPVARWLPQGDILVATWLGRLMRLDGEYQTLWSTVLHPDVEIQREQLLAADDTPTTRLERWGNAATRPAPLTPNLLAETNALIRAVHDPPAHGDPKQWHHDVNLLRDGNPVPPDGPWLHWTDVNYIDSGWRKKLTIEIDTFRTQLKVTGITIVEDSAHAESWQRDMRLEYWDPREEAWRDGPYLLSNQPTHTHCFAEPIEAARFRFVTTGGGTWPYNNLRWGELVFHGEALGASHPDVVAKRPVAVLFDEQEADLKSMMAYGGRPFAFKYDDACSGGKSIALTAAGDSAPHYRPPFGHTIPNWDFEIVEQPKPGQYRWLDFSWKALSDETSGITLHVGPGHQGHLAVVAGEPAKFWTSKTIRIADEPPRDWQTVRVDLWKEWGKDFPFRSLSIAAVGGGAAFDRIRLGRSAEDLDD